jgi:hypothetical protein
MASVLLVTAAALAMPSAWASAEPRSTTSRAADAHARVAVVATTSSEITDRLVDEVRFLGFEPQVVAPLADDDPSALVELARSLDVAAAIRVDAAKGRVQVWVVDRMTGKLVARDLRLDDEGQLDARVVAVRAVELLRASLAELESRPPPPEAEAPVAAPVQRIRRPRTPRFGLWAQAAVAGAPGGLSVLPQVRAGFRYMPHPRIGGVLLGTAPLVAARVRDDEGSATVRIGWLGVGPRVALHRPDAVVVPDVAVVAGPIIATMQGSARPPLRGEHDVVVDAVFEASGGLEVAVSPHVRLRLDAAVGLCARAIGVRFDGRRVAAWCRPYGLGALGIGGVFR